MAKNTKKKILTISEAEKLAKKLISELDKFEIKEIDPTVKAVCDVLTRHFHGRQSKPKSPRSN
jgi:hypothetical protein